MSKNTEGGPPVNAGDSGSLGQMLDLNDHEDLPQIVGRTMRSVVQVGRERIDFVAQTGERWAMYHEQDCCEGVEIEDVAGDLDDLIGSPIVMAEAVKNRSDPARSDDTHDSYTWTFYKIATIRGYVTIRWYGSSDGYSESVSFRRQPDDAPSASGGSP